MREVNKLNKIKKFRLKEKLTQEDLGQLLGVTGRAIGLYERGEREPRLQTAKQLADLFGTTIEDLFNLT